MTPSPLVIKCNAVKRLLKEQAYYSQELLEHEVIMSDMKTKGSDEYEQKKQWILVQEAKRMVLELTEKVEQHRRELERYVACYDGDEDLTFAKSLIEVQKKA